MGHYQGVSPDYSPATRVHPSTSVTAGLRSLDPLQDLLHHPSVKSQFVERFLDFFPRIGRIQHLFLDLGNAQFIIVQLALSGTGGHFGGPIRVSILVMLLAFVACPVRNSESAVIVGGSSLWILGLLARLRFAWARGPTLMYEERDPDERHRGMRRFIVAFGLSVALAYGLVVWFIFIV